MYDTGVAKFLNAAANPNRNIDTKVVLKTSEEITLSTGDISSYKTQYFSTAGKYFTPGNFVASTLELSLNSSSNTVSKIGFKSTPIHSLSVHAGIYASTMVYIPMGVFYPEPDGISIKDDGYITIKATDLPPIMSEVFSSDLLTLPCTVREALNTISQHMGLDIHVSEEDFPNLDTNLSETFELSAPYREVLRYLAETLGAFVHMRRDGSVGIEKIFKGVVNLGCTLDDNYLFSVSQQESMVKPFQYINIKANKSDIGVSFEVDGLSTDKEYNIINNPFTYGHAEDFLEGLVQPTSFSSFHPAKISFHGRPDLDVGDVLEYVYKGTTYLLPVCMHTFEYNGGYKTTIEGTGTDSSTVSSSKDNTQSTSDILALRQSINSLVRDLTETQSQLIDINGDISHMSSILQTVEQLQTQVSQVEGNLEQLTLLSQTADQLKISIENTLKSLAETNSAIINNQATLLTYFDFQSDGLTIGLNTSNVKLKLVNDRIQFLREGIEVAYLSEGQLFVTDAHFLNSLVLGNFEFYPRANGNLSLRRR
jgi:hypothetical protein